MFKLKNTRKKNHGMAFYVIGAFTFAIESMLGINAAFLVDQSVSIVTDNMLKDTPLSPLSGMITLVVSLAVGFCFIFGGMWVFSGFMDSLDDAKAYTKEFKSKRWPETMVWLLMFAVIALDFTTLVFRSAFFAEKGALALFAFFVILILMPPILGPLIHVLEHTPHNRQMAKVRVQTEHRHTASMTKIANDIDDDLLDDLLSDDHDVSQSAVDEHWRRMDARENEKIDGKRARQDEQEEGQEKKDRPLSLASRKRKRA